MRFLVAYGTRPEKIKLQPVIDALRKRGATCETWFSGQSPDLIGEPKELRMHYDSPKKWVAAILSNFDFVTPSQYDAVIVQGDTATAFAVALSAYLAGTPVAHVEAGLRTYRKDPYPEEAFRGMIARLATWHFCPDTTAQNNVLRELGWDEFALRHKDWPGCPAHVVGNTVIDTLAPVSFQVLVTLHRRENWGERIENALDQLYEFVYANKGVHVQVIRHPNWESWGAKPPNPIEEWDRHFVYLPPVPRDRLLEYLQHADLVVTDSGGLQEEAAHYGIPCLVVRESTERVALEQLGAVQLVDPDSPLMLGGRLQGLLQARTAYGYGDAAEKIAEILCETPT
jgi:UDP-N-acetylglucosamine 2-epimerase (non-hydrolysing)